MSILLKNNSKLYLFRRYCNFSSTTINNCIESNKSKVFTKVASIKSFPQVLNYKTFHLTSHLGKTISFYLSDIGEGIREVTVKEWFVNIGDVVEQFDNLCEVQSDKASVTITSRYDGKVLKLHRKVDEIALVGQPLIDFEVKDEESDSSDENLKKEKNSEILTEIKKNQNVSSNELSNNETDKNENRFKVLTTPSVRRLAKENNINLQKVVATGKQGRILKGDVLEYLGIIPVGTNKPHPTLVNKIESNLSLSIPQIQKDRVEPLKGIRKAMLKSMTESMKIPHFAYSDEVDMTNIIKLRNELSTEAIQQGVKKLTFMPFCIKAASLALSQHPILNSSLNLENESLIYKTAHNISVAIDTPDGLVVPNVKSCQNKTILKIAKDLNDLSERARKNNLKPEDFSDGTFSLSNIGILGGTYTHPCILPPQVAIGAMGKTKIVPRFGENGDLIKAHIMCVSWSADHRIIDGVTMAKFSNLWKNYLENPSLFILN